MPTSENDKGRPWPGYFIVRKDLGKIVPLIAVDELPPGVDIVNVPRYLHLEEAKGMLNLGIVPDPDACYEVAFDEDFEDVVSAVDSVEKLKHLAIQHSGPSKAQNQSSAIVTSTTKTPPSTLPSTTSYVKSLPRSTTKPSVSNTAASQVCRFWCHHGICKWGQQCRYRHIMPMTVTGLQEAGLSDWPAWYRTLNPSYFASEEAHTVRAARPKFSRVKHDRDCCGKGKTEKAVVKGTSAGRFVVKEKESGRVLRREEVGEQIMKRLREMSREHEVVKEEGMGVGMGMGIGKVGAGGMVERAVGGGTRRWEDESEEEEEEEAKESEDEEPGVKKKKKKEVVQKQGKLVDV